MKQLAGLLISFFGFLFLTIATETKESMIFEFSLVFGMPMIYFGLKLLVGL